MSKKLMELVTKALKGAGVELSNEVKSALDGALGSGSLKTIGLVELGDGQRIVEEDAYVRTHDDNHKLRKRAQDAEAERDRLKGILDSGDSDNKQRADRLQKENDELKPRAEKVMKRARADWESRVKTLPESKADAKDDEKARVEKIRGRFVFPEKDKTLTDDQVLENLTKFDELAELGVFDVTKPNGNGGGHVMPPPAPRGGGGGHQPDLPVDKDQQAIDWYAKTDPQRPQGNAR